MQLGYLLSELTAFYSAFAHEPLTPEPQDHIVVEASFMAYLKLKEAYALATGDTEHAAIAREAVERFAAEHLSVMAQPLLADLEPIAPSYLVLAGRALLKRVGPPQTATIFARSDEGEMTCGDSFVRLT